MKKNQKRPLSLSTQTVRALDATELRELGGGYLPSGNSWCQACSYISAAVVCSAKCG